MKKSTVWLLFVGSVLFNCVIVVLLLSSPRLLHAIDSDSGSNFSEKRMQSNDYLSRNRENSITQAVRMIEPAIVSINVLKTEVVHSSPYANDPFFGFFDIPMRRQVQSIGTGVIFDNDGHIITNAHVVEGAKTIKVVLPDEREFDGEITGIDTKRDIAVVKINGKEIPYATLGTSSDLIIGEWVIALGNPYGFLMKDSKPSVSVGVISAINRDFSDRNDGKIYKKMIQTDAAINPGNSGGPLVNIDGEVIGINTFIFSDTGGSVGIGFAIPIDTVKKIVKDLVANGSTQTAYFGFKIQDINPMIVSYMHLDNDNGVIVTVVDNNGPAEKAGLHRGDIITHINGTPVKNASDAEYAVSDIAPGDNVTFRIQRNGQKIELKLQTKK